MLGKEKHPCEGRISSGEMSEPWGPALLEQSSLASWKVQGLEWMQAEYCAVSKSAQVGGFWGMLRYPVPLDTPSRGQHNHPLHTELGRGQPWG